MRLPHSNCEIANIHYITFSEMARIMAPKIFLMLPSHAVLANILHLTNVWETTLHIVENARRPDGLRGSLGLFCHTVCCARQSVRGEKMIIPPAIPQEFPILRWRRVSFQGLSAKHRCGKPRRQESKICRGSEEILQ